MSPTVRQRSQLLRFTLWSIVSLAVLACLGFVFESINVTRNVSTWDWDARILRLVALGAANLFFTGLLAMMGALYFWSRVARSLPDLQGWHTEQPVSEFSAAQVGRDFSWDDYQQGERQVFRELDALASDSWSRDSAENYCRYRPQSESNPKRILDRDWNQSHVVTAKNPVGGVVLLHGLSDSPYSLRAIGERLVEEGYSVLWLRLPGHGTSPGALTQVTREDWSAAVSVAVRGMRDQLPSGAPLVLCGYSNGGALSLDYAAEAVEEESLPNVDAVVLFSPMIGVNPLARITRLYHTVGLISRDPKSKWSNICAEVDPFKYSSWPMNANVQAWAVTRAVERKLTKLRKAGRMNELPPVLAMQSVVDSTVVVPKLMTNLFERLSSPASELFLFDVNRMESLSNLVNLSFEKSVLPHLARSDRSYRLSVLANVRPDSSQILLRTWEGDASWDHPVEAEWPKGFVSLSHVAVPIPPDDPVYGASPAPDTIPLGTIRMRAEPGALMIPDSLFVRARYNPFYELMEQHVVQWLSQFVTTKSRQLP